MKTMKTYASRILAGLLCTLALPAAVLAQAAYPNRPIELIVPYPAGGGTDVLGRAFALASVKHLPQNLIVVNTPGASGAIGWADVINGKPEGYKVALLATDLMTQPNMGLTKITYEDFIPIARLNYGNILTSDWPAAANAKYADLGTRCGLAILPMHRAGDLALRGHHNFRQRRRRGCRNAQVERLRKVSGFFQCDAIRSRANRGQQEIALFITGSNNAIDQSPTGESEPHAGNHLSR